MLSHAIFKSSIYGTVLCFFFSGVGFLFFLVGYYIAALFSNHLICKWLHLAISPILLRKKNDVFKCSHCYPGELTHFEGYNKKDISPLLSKYL